MLRSALALLLGASQVRSSYALPDSQVVLGSSHIHKAHGEHMSKEAILAAIKTHSDPVAAMIALDPETAAHLDEPRLLHIFGEDKATWLTEGDKLRLRRQGKKFMDITDHHEFYSQQMDSSSGKANLPPLRHQRLVKPLLAKISTEKMHDSLKHLTSFYSRYFASTYGAKSARWLHDHIAEIIDSAPFGTQISLEYFTHPFPQPSIIARFEPKIRNASLPLTILGAHQDSANYLFPLLPAPGADDDGSGTVTILEAFRVLAESGYTPLYGPVEFHWYAAEEGGLLGSQRVARDKKEQGATIWAMLQFDTLAFVAKNATESIGIISIEADSALTNWTLQLSKEYVSIPAALHGLPKGTGSDHMAYTRLNYPAAFAFEGNPMRGGFPGDLNPSIHGINDTMDIDGDAGRFSFDHMARFAELAIAFAVEQGGWNNIWR